MTGTITIQTVDAVTGISPTYQAISSSGEDNVPSLTTLTYLHVVNGSAVAIEVTIKGTPDITVDVAAATLDEDGEKFIGPFDIAYGPTMNVHYDLDGGGSIEYADTLLIFIAALKFAAASYVPGNIITLSGGVFSKYQVIDGGIF